MSEQPADPARTTSADASRAAATPGTSTSGDDSPAQPPHEGDHRDPASARTESERELTETVRSISRLEESN